MGNIVHPLLYYFLPNLDLFSDVEQKRSPEILKIRCSCMRPTVWSNRQHLGWKQVHGEMLQNQRVNNRRFKHSKTFSRTSVWSHHSQLGLGVTCNVSTVPMWFHSVSAGKSKHGFLYNGFCIWQSHDIWLFTNTSQVCPNILCSFLTLYAKDTLQTTPSPFRRRCISFVWPWEKGGSPVCHSLKHTAAVYEVFMCHWSVNHCVECRKTELKGKNLLLQTLKQHVPNQSESSQPACSWNVKMLSSESITNDTCNTVRLGCGVEGKQRVLIWLWTHVQ